MTCPRCGGPLPVGARFCPRCGATVAYGHPPPSPPGQFRPQMSPYAPTPGQVPPPGTTGNPYQRQRRAPLGEPSIRAARIIQLLAALACLVHGVASMTLRRAAYVDLGAGRGGSASSDQLNVVLLSIASLSSLGALAVALLVLARGRGRSPASGAGLALFVVGWLVVLVGAALVAGADTQAEASTAAAASVLVGVGFVVVALGHTLLAVGLNAPVQDGSLATAPYLGPDPYVGTPLARHPADRPAVRHAPG